MQGNTKGTLSVRTSTGALVTKIEIVLWPLSDNERGMLNLREELILPKGSVLELILERDPHHVRY